MERVDAWKAFTGTVFPTQEACLAHEREQAHVRLVGLTLEQVMAAIERRDLELADAIEVVGTRIANDRREAGEFKRQRKSAAQEPALAIEGPHQDVHGSMGADEFARDFGLVNPPNDEAA